MWGDMQQAIDYHFEAVKDLKILSRTEEESLYPHLKNCEKARKKLIEGNLRIALKSAWAFHKKNKRFDIDELVSEANLGLVMALDKFDPERGYRFSSYAQCWIDNRLKEYEHRNNNAIPMSKDIHYKAKKAIRLEILGASPEEIAKELDCSIEALESLERHKRHFSNDIVSLHTESEMKADENQYASSEIITAEISVENGEAEEKSVEDEIIMQMMIETDILNEKEKECLFALHGFLDKPKQTHQELSEKLGLVVSRVRAIQKKAMLKTQAHIGT